MTSNEIDTMALIMPSGSNRARAVATADTAQAGGQPQGGGGGGGQGKVCTQIFIILTSINDNKGKYLPTYLLRVEEEAKEGKREAEGEGCVVHSHRGCSQEASSSRFELIRR